MKRTDAHTWYSHDGKWKVSRDINGTCTLIQVSRGPFTDKVAPQAFQTVGLALAELSRLEGPKAYVDEWLAYLRKVEAKGGPKVEVDTFKIVCLACGGRKTNIDTTKTLRGVPVVPCPRCEGTGMETVETAR